MIRTYKRKLILNKAQETRIKSWIGACRVVYNMGMQIKNETYKAYGKNVHKYDLSKQLTDIRDIDWVEDVPRASLEAVLDTLDNTYSNFFRNYKKGGGYPRFASKRNFTSIKFKTVNIRKGYAVLPKIGKIKIFKDEEIKGTPRTAYIKIEPTGFFLSVQCKNVPPKFVSENQTIGLDMGVSSFCVDSNGISITNPKHFTKYEDRLRIENRSLARKKKGSNSWIKQAKTLSLLHHKIGNVRKDFLQKESTMIARLNSIVYLEGLNIKGMSKNKSLSKHILDCGWGLFKTMLQYKTTVVLVNPKYTSQTCHGCGQVDSKSRISQSEFCCTSCGHISHADVNAAKNIKEKGILLDRKREPLG